MFTPIILTPQHHRPHRPRCRHNACFTFIATIFIVRAGRLNVARISKHAVLLAYFPSSAIFLLEFDQPG